MIPAGDRHWLTKSVAQLHLLGAKAEGRGQSSFADSVAKTPLLCVGHCICMCLLVVLKTTLCVILIIESDTS